MAARHLVRFCRLPCLQAAKAKVGRFVYVSVSHLVPEALEGVAFEG